MQLRIALAPVDPDHPRAGLPRVTIDLDGVPLAEHCSGYRLSHDAGGLPVLDLSLNILGIDLRYEIDGVRAGSVSVGALGPVSSITLADGTVLDGPRAIFAALSALAQDQHRAAGVGSQPLARPDREMYVGRVDIPVYLDPAAPDADRTDVRPATDAEVDHMMRTGMLLLEVEGDPIVALPDSPPDRDSKNGP